MDYKRFIPVIIILVGAFLLIFGLLWEEAPRRIEEVPPVEVEIVEEVPPEEPVALLAIVLDDFGYSKKNLKRIKELNIPITLAVLPNIYYSEAASSLASDNIEIILHLPMEPESLESSLEENTLTSGMDEGKIREVIDGDLKSVKNARGISNHMGSKGTRDERVVSVVMDEAKGRDMYFLDSMTTSGSVCEKIAKEKNVPFARRDIFIDNVLENGKIKEELNTASGIALKKGSAVAIGHDRRETVEALTEEAPLLKKKGIKFVKLSEVTRK